jgi:hypothetical protein
MYIGLGIFLIVVGAILTFAIDASSVGGVDLQTIGWICMIAGVLAILLSLVLTNRRGVAGGGYSARRVSHTDPATGTQVDEVEVDRDGRV